MYGRDLLLLRGFATQPADLSMPIAPELSASRQSDTQQQIMKDLRIRCDRIRRRIEGLMAEEIKLFLDQEEKGLNRLVVETEYFYAEALTKRNQEVNTPIHQESE